MTLGGPNETPRVHKQNFEIEIKVRSCQVVVLKSLISTSWFAGVEWKLYSSVNSQLGTASSLKLVSIICINVLKILGDIPCKLSSG